MAIIPAFFMEATVALGVEDRQGPAWCATGFVVGRYEATVDGDKRYTTYLVTNRHVVQNSTQMVMQVNSVTGIKQYSITLTTPRQEVWYSTHPEADVIAHSININPALEEGANIPFFHLDDHALTLQQMRDTGVCEGSLAYTLGFPVSIAKDFVNSAVKSPVCRMGCISRVENVYHGAKNKSFLIDAMTFPGNSGGPVISRPENISIIDTPHNGNANLIGIVSSYLPYQELLQSTQTQRIRMVNEENSGLTVVIPVDCIKEVVEMERTRFYGIETSDILPELSQKKQEERMDSELACV